MDKVRSQEEQKPDVLRRQSPPPEQMIIRTDCIALRGEAVKRCESGWAQQLGKRR